LTEREKILENYRKHQLEEQAEQLSNNSELIENFIKHCNKKGIEISNNDIRYVQTIGIVAFYPNLVNLLNNKIEVDKEELVSFDILNKEYSKQPFASGFLFSDNYMIMAHPYFRRGHYENNNFSPRFIEIYWNYDKVNNDKYIALDLDRVRINVDNLMYMEFDTWYGAKFKKKISDIEDGIVKLRPPLDLEGFDIEFFFGNTYSLNIKWYTKNGIKVFQAEEFKAENSRVTKNGIEYFPAKYIHSEFDEKAGTFRHFDGAIHFYTKEEYFQKRDTDFNYNNKNDLQIKTLSQKLFKLNGEIKIDDWVELTSHYLTGNPLIFEYFEGKLPDRIIETVEKLRISRKNKST